MIISIQFKDKNKVFKGKVYDYRLNPEEKPPKAETIIRLMNDNYDYLHYGTRVKVVGVRKAQKGEGKNLISIRYVEDEI